MNEALELAAEEAMQRRNALAEARRAAKAARDKQRDEELQRLMKECVPSTATSVSDGFHSEPLQRRRLPFECGDQWQGRAQCKYYVQVWVEVTSNKLQGRIDLPN